MVPIYKAIIENKKAINILKKNVFGTDLASSGFSWTSFPLCKPPARKLRLGMQTEFVK